MVTRRPLTLSAYGKLPLAREFLRARCNEGPALAFRQFLDEAAPHCSGRDLAPEQFVQLSSSLPGFGRAQVVATIWASADEGGLRPFPFSFYVVLEESRREVLGWWTSLDGILADQRAAHERAVELTNAAAFDAAFGGAVDATARTSEDTARSQSGVADIPLAAWIGDLYPGDGEAFVTLLWRLRTLLADGPLGQARSVRGVRLPLSWRYPVAAQVDAWLRVLARGEESLGYTPALVVSGHGSPSLTILAAALRPSDMAVVRGGDVAGVVDLTVYQEPLSLEGFGRFSDRLRQYLGERQGSLALLWHMLEPQTSTESGRREGATDGDLV